MAKGVRRRAVPHVLRLQQPLESSRDRQEPGLAAGAPDELHADRHADPVAAHRKRHGAQTEKIDDAGVAQHA